ncbi:MAG: RluA family pseudouridine synthase [Steroidobacteraceae bacterium]
MQSPPEIPVPRIQVSHVLVTSEEAGQRLDKVLSRLLTGVPRTHLFRLLRKGEVRVNGKRAKPEQRLVEGDDLRLPPVRPAAVTEGPRPVPRRLTEQLEAAIVHEDDKLIVIDKPSGLAVHGGSGMAFGVIEALRASRPQEELELVHRLDRDTSGCLLIARKRSALRALHALLREGDFDKGYLALLGGKWELGTKRIAVPLRTDLRVGGERTVKVDAGGKEAVTEIRPVQFFGKIATLVAVRLFTGRTHQIRVHAAYAGHPVAGDDKYGNEELNAILRERGLKRLFLHAHSVGFRWPESGNEVSINTPLPEELKAVLDRLSDGSVRKLRPPPLAKAEENLPRARRPRT